MSFDTATYFLFFLAAAAGAVCFRHSMKLGENLSPGLRWALRANLGFCVFVAVWGLSAFSLWSAGAPLTIGSVAKGRMHEASWIGPAACLFAMASYGALREGSNGKHSWPFSRTVGGVVVIAAAVLMCLYGWHVLRLKGS